MRKTAIIGGLNLSLHRRDGLVAGKPKNFPE